MKKQIPSVLRIITLLSVVIILGCEKKPDEKNTLESLSNEAIELDMLVMRGTKGNELFYAINRQSPYTGWVKSYHSNGVLKSLAEIVNGKLNGIGIEWYENGLKKKESQYKDGNLDG